MKNHISESNTRDSRTALPRFRVTGIAGAALLSSLLIVASHGQLQAREFLNTFLHFNIAFSYNQTFGNVLKAERREPLIITAPYFAQLQRPTHLSYSFGIFADIVPFNPIMFREDRSAIKFGLRAGYRFSNIRQSMAVKKFSGSHFTYRSAFFTSEAPLFGPIIRFAPVVKEDPITHEYVARGGITMFAMYGRLINARLNGRPSIFSGTNDVATYISAYQSFPIAQNYLLQEYTKLMYYGFPSSNVRGDRVEVGMGGEIGIFYFNLGVNLVYSKVWLQQSFATHFTVSKSTQLDEFMLEVYLGLPVEWSFVPKVQ